MVDRIKIKGREFFNSLPLVNGEWYFEDADVAFTEDMIYLMGKEWKVGGMTEDGLPIVDGWTIPLQCIEGIIADKPKNPSHNALDRQVGGSHYKKGGMQPFELFERVEMKFGFSNVLKYGFRHKDKNKKMDMEKVFHYIELIEDMYGDIVSTNPSCWYNDTNANRALFSKFIATNPQLDYNQICMILAVREMDIDMLKKFAVKEMEECYGGHESEGKSQGRAEEEADKDAGR